VSLFRTSDVKSAGVMAGLLDDCIGILKSAPVGQRIDEFVASSIFASSKPFMIPDSD
jgi:hypothetical protein